MENNGILILRGNTVWILLPSLLLEFLDADPADNSSVEADNLLKLTFTHVFDSEVIG